jgi:hypothetical protein
MYHKKILMLSIIEFIMIEIDSSVLIMKGRKNCRRIIKKEKEKEKSEFIN